MKIECDKCGAKYSIADEKVRGKTFKIRCKKCSNVIIVRDKSAAAEAPAEPEAEAGPPGWHLAIDGETVGPVDEDDVRARYHAQEIDKETAVWQEGFEDWIPLGDVSEFGDLPDHEPAAHEQPLAAAAEDPFAAAAGQDEYAAAGGAAVGMAGAAAGAADLGGAESPRVSSLTGQRNENSVLFSLDNLQALATGPAAAKPAAAASAAGTRGLATSAPSSEGSGLIDIRALGAMVGGGEEAAASPGGGPAPSAAADDAALPSFGGSGFGGLAATPLVAQPVGGGGAAAPQRSNAPLYAIVVILLLGLVGMGWFAFFREPQVVVQEKEVPVVSSVKDGADDGDKDVNKGAEGAKDDEGEETEGEEEGTGEEGTGGEVAADGASKKAGGRTGRKKGGRSGSGSKGKEAGGLPDPAPDTGKSSGGKSGGGKDNYDVDCILNPDLPKCKKKGGGSKKSGGGAAKKDPNLPDKLGSSQIRSGIAPVKGTAKACGRKHGAKPGEKVKIKISIKGSTGRVTNASAKPPHAGTALGTCVAAALKKATFPKFNAASLGVVYPVTM